MSDYLPPDALTEILSRLPVKTLVRCFCVCKSWKSLIKNPKFITAHLNRSTLANGANNGGLTLIRTWSFEGKQEEYSLRYDDEIFGEHTKFKLPLMSDLYLYFRIVGVCNGLICLSDEDDKGFLMESLFLWNPSIRKYLPIPTPRVGFMSHGTIGSTLGFGFDSVTNDYKVVRIVYVCCSSKPPEVDVFTLSTGVWRDISHLGLQHLIYFRTPQAYLRGASHWLGRVRNNVSENGDRHLIVCFDMGDEVFRELRLPPGLAEQERIGDVHVAKCQESLCLIRLSSSLVDKVCSVWIMKEYGVVESWTKQFNIDYDGGIERCAGFRSNGEAVVAVRGGHLLSYNLKDETFKNLGIRGYIKDEPYLYSLFAEAYTESLVSLGVGALDIRTSDEPRQGESEAKKAKKKERKKAKRKGKTRRSYF